MVVCVTNNKTHTQGGYGWFRLSTIAKASNGRFYDFNFSLSPNAVITYFPSEITIDVVDNFGQTFWIEAKSNWVDEWCRRRLQQWRPCHFMYSVKMILFNASTVRIVIVLAFGLGLMMMVVNEWKRETVLSNCKQCLLCAAHILLADKFHPPFYVV